MMTKASTTLSVMALGTLAAALLTGCNDSGSDASDDGGVGGPSEAVPSASSSASKSASSSAVAGGDDAAFTAITTVEADGGKAIGLDRQDDGPGGYKVDVLDADTVFEVTVDASGKNPGQRTKSASDAAERDRLQGIDVPLAEALKAAQADEPGKNIDEAEIDDDDGMLAWNIELDVDKGQGSTEIVVDAKTGDVVK